MLTAELKINGLILGTLYMVNTQESDGVFTKYDVEYHRVGSGTVIKTKVAHNYDDGAEVLVATALAKVMKSAKFKKICGSSSVR